MGGHEVGQDASARLIHDDESVEAFMETHFHEGVQVETVQVVRFAKFITDVVAKRKLPTSAGVTTPRVVIKADIEGAELKIIPDMVVTGAFGHVDNLHMEWHGNASYRQALGRLQRASCAHVLKFRTYGAANSFVNFCP